MLTMKSCPLELRGAISKQTKNGKLYVLLNCETDVGEHYQFYSGDPNIVTPDLKKGDKVVLVFAYSVYDKQERLSVIGIDKVE